MQVNFLFCFPIDSECFGNHFRVGANYSFCCLLQINSKGGRTKRSGATRDSTPRGLDESTNKFSCFQAERLLCFLLFFWSFGASVPLSKGITRQQEQEKGKQEQKR